MHTFEISGLGKAPFSIVNPTADDINHALPACEHCGTQLRNLHFIRSADGRVSVVGIDCLKKSGDAGLIDGQRRIERQQKNEKREAAIAAATAEREAAQREKNGGKTNHEIQEDLEAQIQQIGYDYREALLIDPIVRMLNGQSLFEKSIELQLYAEQELTAGQLRVVIEIIAKRRSGARKGSTKYLSEVNATVADVKNLNQLVSSMLEKKTSLREDIRALYY